MGGYSAYQHGKSTLNCIPYHVILQVTLTLFPTGTVVEINYPTEAVGQINKTVKIIIVKL